MRKKAIALYTKEMDRVFLLAKVGNLPWLKCEALQYAKITSALDCHILLFRCEDLPTLLSLKRKTPRYGQIPMLVFSPLTQMPVLKMMDSALFRVVGEDILQESLSALLKALLSSKTALCAEGPCCYLTLRERQVLALILSGESNVVIAERLGVRLSTIYAHKKNLFLKTGVHTTSQLVVWALLKEFAP